MLEIVLLQKLLRVIVVEESYASEIFLARLLTRPMFDTQSLGVYGQLGLQSVVAEIGWYVCHEDLHDRNWAGIVAEDWSEEGKSRGRRANEGSVSLLQVAGLQDAVLHEVTRCQQTLV